MTPTPPQDGDTIRRCIICGEVMPNPHDCDLAREARAVFEAAKHANSPESAMHLADIAYALADQAETVRVI